MDAEPLPSLAGSLSDRMLAVLRVLYWDESFPCLAMQYGGVVVDERTMHALLRRKLAVLSNDGPYQITPLGRQVLEWLHDDLVPIYVPSEPART